MINHLPRMGTLVALPFLVALAACDRAPVEPRVTVAEAWVRLPAVPGHPAGGYFTATATADGEELRQVTSPAARVEMHETITEDGRAGMRPLPVASFDAGKPLRFAPGGKHLMLFDLERALRPGETISLTFRFKSASPVTLDARLVGAGETPEHDGH